MKNQDYRLHTQRKNNQRLSSVSSSTPVPGIFESRPFVVQQKQQGSSQQPNLKASLMGAERYGHHLGRIKPTGISTSHELTHVVQQKGGAVQRSLKKAPQGTSSPVINGGNRTVHSAYQPNNPVENPVPPIQAKPSFSDIVNAKDSKEQPSTRPLDNITKYLVAKDIASLSQVDKKTNNELKPLVPQVLAQEMFQPTPANENAKGLEGSNNVEHVHKEGGDNALQKVRSKLKFLSMQKQIVTRSMNKTDAEAIKQGNPIMGKGSGEDIAKQVAGKETGLISASERPMNKFSSGSAGHIAIKRPEHYENKAALAKKFPETVMKPNITSASKNSHKDSFISHEKVMKGVENSSESDQNNAREAAEVMFKGPLPLEHVVHLDEGVGQEPIVKSKNAIERGKAKEEKGASRNEGAMKQIRKAHKDMTAEEHNALYDQIPKDVLLKGNTGIKKWLNQGS